MPADITLLDVIALCCFIIAWNSVTWIGRHYKDNEKITLKSTSKAYRNQWMLHLLTRTNRISDVSLIGNLMRSVSFFASTSILILASVIAVFGVIEETVNLFKGIPFALQVSTGFLKLKLLLLVLIFIHVFFKLVWSLRQFNSTVIMIGAAPDVFDTDEEIVSDFEHRWLVYTDKNEIVMTTQEIKDYVDESTKENSLDVLKIGDAKPLVDTEIVIPPKNNDKLYRSIISVEEVESVPTKCIEVDSPSSTFLCGKNLLVTHNTNKPKNFKIQAWTGNLLSPFEVFNDTALEHYKIQLPLYGRLLLEMLKGTKYDNIKFFGCIIVHLLDDGSYSEYRVENEFINTIFKMDPLIRIDEVMKHKKLHEQRELDRLDLLM